LPPLPEEIQAEIDEAKTNYLRVVIRAMMLYGHGVTTVKWKKRYGKSPLQVALGKKRK
jgi:hypothetical protein